MKRLINAFRDFIYNITDYGLILVVVLVMMSLLVWRFDILFNKNIVKEAIAETIPEYISGKNEDNNNDDEIPGQINKDPNSEQNNDVDNNKDNDSNVIATVEIPQGSFPSKIGDILINSNLIDDKSAFLDRSVELGLDTKLRSGTFEIALGTNLDEVIKIIAHAN